MNTIKQEASQIDPLRRVFVPVERKNTDGTYVLRTHDKTTYIRGADGVLRRQIPKMNGKDARRARRMMRREHQR